MNEFEKQPWIGRARELLDDSVTSLDAATLSRLNRARQAALAQRRPWRLPTWMPALGFACAALLVVAVLWVPQRHGEVASPRAPAGGIDAEIGGADDSIEFYQNLDFYAWLEAQDADIDG